MTVVTPNSIVIKDHDIRTLRIQDKLRELHNSHTNTPCLRKALDGLLERGNPDKAARVIYQLAAHPEPPFRLPLGKDALEVFREKLGSTVAEVEKFASWSD